MPSSSPILFVVAIFIITLCQPVLPSLRLPDLFLFLAVTPSYLLFAGIINNAEPIHRYNLFYSILRQPIHPNDFYGEWWAWWKSAVPFERYSLTDSKTFLSSKLSWIMGWGDHWGPCSQTDLGFTSCHSNPTVLRYFSSSRDSQILWTNSN